VRGAQFDGLDGHRVGQPAEGTDLDPAVKDKSTLESCCL
jgi:hypothetical protein